MGKFSVFEYFYRDASNCKSWGCLLLSGSANKSDIQGMQSRFDAGCCFIAEQLSIPPLYSEPWALSNGPSTDDHVWHTYHALRPACEQDRDATVYGTVEDLIEKNQSHRRLGQNVVTALGYLNDFAHNHSKVSAEFSRNSAVPCPVNPATH